MLIFSARIRAFAHEQRGLSLIEMMISITIGLLILSAMATLFSNQSKVRGELDKSNRMIDNGRYALEMLSESLSMAGFYGSYVPTSGAPAATPDSCNLTTLTTAGSNLDVLRHHIQGFDAATATDDPAVSGAAECDTYATANSITTKDGSDMLVMRRVSTATPVTVANKTVSPNGSNTVYLQVSNCTVDTTSYLIARGSNAFNTLRDKDCTAAASLRAFIVQIYYVSTDNNAGDGIPTLKRIELDQASGELVTTPLVEGIEYMQVEYGVDGDSDGDGIVDLAVFDGAPDSYVQICPNATCWSRVMSVKIHIVARNIEPTPGYTDTKTYVLGTTIGGLPNKFGPFNTAPYNAAPYPTTYPTLANYKRHAYTKVVRLVNPSGRLAP